MNPMPRNPHHDLIKGLAVLLMMQVHVMELFAQQHVMDGVAGQLSLFLGAAPVAPVFMLLFGFYALRAPVWPGRLLWRAIKLMLAGAVLNVGLNLHLLVRIVQGQSALDPRPYLFGVDILLLAGLSLVLITLLRPLLKAHAWAWLLASVGVATLSPWMSAWLATETELKWLVAFVASDAAWAFFPLFPWLAYPLLGVAWFHGQPYLARLSPWRAPLGLGMAVLLLVTGPFALATSHHLSGYYHHDLRFFLWAIGFAAGWFWLLPHLSRAKRLHAWLSWFGQHITACYVVQWLLIGNLATALYKTQSLLACLLWVLALVLLTRWIVSMYLQTKRFQHA